jgi:hypothetical protein
MTDLYFNFIKKLDKKLKHLEQYNFEKYKQIIEELTIIKTTEVTFDKTKNDFLISNKFICLLKRNKQNEF